MIRGFNSAYRNTDERLIALDEVNIVTQGICQFTAKPYILFEHKDFPLGAVQAEFDGASPSFDIVLFPYSVTKSYLRSLILLIF